MGTPIIAGNWKMNTTLQEACELASRVRLGLETVSNVQTIVCPPFISLVAVSEILSGSTLHLGAQNIFPDSGGPYTGEISATMLSDLCQFVILGHSERRQLFGETNDFVNRKVASTIAADLSPILCVGENLKDRQAGRAEEVVEKQIIECLKEIDPSERLVIAYEPIWAIGTGEPADPQVTQHMMSYIREVLVSLFGREIAASTSLLYGGSVTPENILEYIKEEDVDGALVGGASLIASSFIQLVLDVAKAKTNWG